MTLSEIVKHALILLPVFLSLFITGGCAAVFAQAFRRMRATSAAYLDVGGWVALMVAVVLNVIVLGGMGISNFKEIVLDGWAGVGGLVSILLPIFGFKVFQGFSSRGGSNTGGPTP